MVGGEEWGGVAGEGEKDFVEHDGEVYLPCISN